MQKAGHIYAAVLFVTFQMIENSSQTCPTDAPGIHLHMSDW